MKRLLAYILVIILAFSFVSCGESKEENGSSNSSGHQAFLEADPEKGETYQAATNAYNKFLSGTLEAKDKTTGDSGKSFTIKEMTSAGNGSPGIDAYALFDVNGDGIPELHTASFFYDIFSYQDGQLVLWYEVPFNRMDGSVFPLENRAIFAQHDTTGKFYYYVTFSSDGKPTVISFSERAELDSYNFNDKDVTKAEYDNLTKEYFELSKNTAKIDWINTESYKTWQEAYTDSLDKIEKEDTTFSLKDLDKDGTPELILIKTDGIVSKGVLTAYTFRNSVVKLGDYHDAKIGVAALRVSEKAEFPGLFTMTWGGGIENYGYLSVRDGKLTFENLWVTDRTGSSPVNVEVSANKELVKESMDAFTPYNYSANILKMYPLGESNVSEIINAYNPDAVTESGSNQSESKVPSETSESNPKALMPDKSYIGLWYNDRFKLDSLNILEINDKITFELTKYRLGLFTGTASLKNNRIDFIGYTGDNIEISGTMIFHDDHIVLIITNSDDEWFYGGETYNFCIRD
jgi:hypothetical protein